MPFREMSKYLKTLQKEHSKLMGGQKIENWPEKSQKNFFRTKAQFLFGMHRGWALDQKLILPSGTPTERGIYFLRHHLLRAEPELNQKKLDVILKHANTVYESCTRHFEDVRVKFRAKLDQLLANKNPDPVEVKEVQTYVRFANVALFENFLTRNRKEEQKKWEGEYGLQYKHSVEFVRELSKEVIDWLLLRDGSSSEGFYFNDYDFKRDETIDEILKKILEKESISLILDDLLLSQLESIKSDIFRARVQSQLDAHLLDKAFEENKEDFLVEMKKDFKKTILESREVPLKFPVKIYGKIRRKLSNVLGFDF